MTARVSSPYGLLNGRLPDDNNENDDDDRADGSNANDAGHTMPQTNDDDAQIRCLKIIDIQLIA